MSPKACVALIFTTTFFAFASAGYEVSFFAGGTCASGEELMVREFKDNVCIAHKDGHSSKFICNGNMPGRFRTWTTSDCTGEKSVDIMDEQLDTCISGVKEGSIDVKRWYSCDVPNILDGDQGWYFERSGDSEDNKCALFRELRRNGGALQMEGCVLESIETDNCFLTGVPKFGSFARGCVGSKDEGMSATLAIPDEIADIPACIQGTWECVGVATPPSSCAALAAAESATTECMVRRGCCSHYTTMLALLSKTHAGALSACEVDSSCESLASADCVRAADCVAALAGAGSCVENKDWREAAHACFEGAPCCALWEPMVAARKVGALENCEFLSPPACSGSPALLPSLLLSLVPAALALLVPRRV